MPAGAGEPIGSVCLVGSGAVREASSTRAPWFVPARERATGCGVGESAHVGLVERVFPGGQITTIDGNFGNIVARSGPFLPSQAVAYGMPGPVYGYAHPPSSEGEVGADG